MLHLNELIAGGFFMSANLKLFLKILFWIIIFFILILTPLLIAVKYTV